MKAALPLLLFLAACSGPESAVSKRPSSFLTVEALESLPHVHRVQITPASKEPKRQIIHILDWHFVHKEELAAELRTEAEKAGETLSEAEMDREWELFLVDVEAVQGEQLALLGEMVKFHGLKTVFLERLSEAEMTDYRELAEMMKNWKEPSGDDPTDQFMRDLNRQDRLLLGAASRVEGLEILGAEDAEALEAANPIKDGRVEWDDAANEWREDAIVRNILASESPIAVLVMGGAHDLADNTERIGGDVEYVRVQVEAYRKAAGE